MYWGDQPIVAAPAYIGALMLFLFVLGIYLVKNNLKKWLVSAVVFSIILSWGKNFDIITNFFIDYVPLYNKFRAVSSIQVIAEIAIPLLGILAVQKFLDPNISKEDKTKALKWSTIIVGGLALLFTLLGTNLFAFESFRDATYENMVPGFTSVLIEDRRVLFFQDSARTLLFVAGFAAFLWLYLREKINKNLILGVFLVLVLMDMVGVARRYVNNEDFISAKKLEKPFAMTEVDAEILKDKGHYRVMNFMVNPMNDGSTSFYHNSIGGYHAAKPRRYQELFDFQIAKNNIEVLNMLNAKYIIFPDSQDMPNVQLNPESNGNAWFVNQIKYVDSANEEIKALDSLDTKNEVVVRSEFKNQLKDFQFQKDTLAAIDLVNYKANEIAYESYSAVDQIAVFSEIYYEDGWNAYIDDKLTSHFRANYVLRGMLIPKGKHTIVFKFEPRVIEQGSMFGLISYGLLILISLVWFLKYRKEKVL